MLVKREVIQFLENYQEALGLTIGDDVQDLQKLPQLSDDPDHDISLPAATQEHPELAKIKAEIIATKAEIKSARAAFLPKIELFANYRTIGHDEHAIENSWADDHLLDFTVGAKLTINLFNGFKDWHRVKKKKLETESARIHLKQKKRELSKILSQKNLNIINNIDDLRLKQRRLKVEKRKEKIAQINWRRGECSQMEYRQQQNAVQEARDKIVTAKIDIDLARLNLLLVSLEK
jgi:outer membrane protein TolC